MPDQSDSIFSEESAMTFLPSLSLLIGKDEAIFLQYLTGKLQQKQNVCQRDGKRWTGYARDEWQMVFFFWPKKKLQRVLSHLQHFSYQGQAYPLVYLSSFQQEGFPYRKWLTVNQDVCQKLIPIAHQRRLARLQDMIQKSPTLQKRLPEYLQEHPELIPSTLPPFIPTDRR